MVSQCLVLIQFSTRLVGEFRDSFFVDYVLKESKKLESEMKNEVGMLSLFKPAMSFGSDMTKSFNQYNKLDGKKFIVEKCAISILQVGERTIMVIRLLSALRTGSSSIGKGDGTQDCR